ncbi:uncharacterized protein KIAA1522 homolog [Parambassis ranga]|uniref:Uncharacterized protein KIAA1522 homolog n=1 Tax=Parambassis ranga TaxID=210632 RepID=A0A6P7HJY3_9TELE|nr:uncharacterized protein KIAA1522 homolog [Parambassis ranga]
MSNRDSLGFGDLLPQDVVDIFAQEKHSKRGRKKRTRSLGRAFGWLKGKRKKRKDHSANGQSLGLGPALDLALDGHSAGHQGGHKGGQKSGRQAHPHGNSHAVPKRNNDDKTPAPPLLQENVFIEAPTRPKYLEDLHTEALEGLKMMQQEETNNGVEYQDNESTISTMSVQTDGEGGGFATDSTIPDTSSVVSMQSSVSARSSRSGLTRQGSTFRPLNSGKKSEKSRARRRHRKTVAGIPYHVQRELGLDRVDWTLTQNLEEEQLYNGDSEYSTTNDETRQTGSSQEKASASIQAQNIRQPLTKDAVKQQGAAHAGHRDDLALLHHLGPDLAGGPRPRSLAAPWMTTASSLQQDPPSPVMSMSPQAAYMSKIIPNAVLPPSIEVVEISRGQSRSSVRTVSKSSLLMSSPAPSRASSRASSSRTTSSRASTITSASRYNPPNLSDSSCWSNSESSETLVSDSSTISSSSTPRQIRSQNGDTSSKDEKISVQLSISKTSRCTSNGKLIIKGDEVKKEGQFVRSLSVMKSKRAPPPPNRSYSLHSKMKRRSRDLAELKVSSGESSLHRVSAPGEEKTKPGSSPMPRKTVDSPGYNADTSSLDDSTGSLSLTPIRSQLQVLKTENADAGPVSEDASQKKQEPETPNQMISPSSGYSSQDATSPLHSKQPPSSSPRHKKGILAKLQRLFPGSTSAGSAPSLPTQPDIKLDSVSTVSVSPSVRTLRELFSIPPHPKVHAPPPPPPECWAHNKRTFELLLGPPAPDNTYAIIKKNPKDRRQQRQSPSVSTEGSVKSLVVERKHKNQTVEAVEGSLNVQKAEKVEESGILNVEIHKENDERLAQNVDLNGNRNDEKAKVSDILSGMLVKAMEKRGERLAAKREEEAKKTSPQTAELKTHINTSSSISLVRISPSPSPPLQPQNRPTTEVASVTSQVLVSPESSWPPPPPPMIPVGLNGPDEVDFPPPPPMFAEEDLVLPVQVPPKTSIIGSDSSASVKSVVKTENVKLITVAEPQKPSTSQEVVHPPLNIPPPPPYSAPPPPVLPSTTKFSVPPKQVIPPKQVSPPPSSEDPSPQPPPPVDVSPVRTTESSPPDQGVLPLLEDVSPALVRVVSTTPAEEVSPVQVNETSPLPPEEVPAPSPGEVTPPPAQEDAPVEATPLSKLTPPQSIPPPPPLPSEPQSSEQEIDLPQENILSEPKSDHISSNSVLLPPQSIPPPPPLQPAPQVVSPKTDDTKTLETPPLHPSVDSPSPENPLLPEKDEESALSQPANIPLPPPLPLQGLDSVKQEPGPLSTKNPSQEPTPASVPPEEPTPLVTPSLLQMVKLRSVNSSPEPPKAEEQPESEVTMREQQPRNQVPTSSASADAPQKPIRRSLIVTSPTSTSPPAIGTSQPALPKSQSLVLPPASSSTVLSPMKKSPAAMTTSPSMNLQEAIRLRTAARSKEGPVSRLSLHSPTSPMDFHKSPTSTASFIFSKSNKKMVIETKLEAKEDIQNNHEVSPVTKVISESESLKKGAKVPPPVARKPKTMGKEVETSEGAEQTAGQEAQQESIKDAAEKTNGTAGTVEGGEASLT